LFIHHLYAINTDYVGCYLDTNNNRAIAVSTPPNRYISFDECKNQAINLGYIYFAIQDYLEGLDGGACYLSNSLEPFQKHQALNTSDAAQYGQQNICYTVVTNGVSAVVGGGWSNAVHVLVGVPTRTPTVAPSLPPTYQPTNVPTGLI